MAPKRKRKQDEKPKRRSKRYREASVKNAIASVNERDWRFDKNLPASMLTMFKDEICCDVQFLCGEEEEPVKAHKFVLVCRSSVFFAMFEGPASSDEDDIKVPDIAPDIFRSFLQFLYSDKINLTQNTLMHIMYAGKKYQVHSLINECTKFVEKNLTLDNACMLMEGAHMYSEPALQGIVLQFIEDNAVYILRSTTMRDLCPECFGMILESNNLSNIYETDETWYDHYESLSESGSVSYSESVSESVLDSHEEPARHRSGENQQEDGEAGDIEGSEHQPNNDNPSGEGSSQQNDENPPKAEGEDHEESGGEDEEDFLSRYVALENSVFEALLYWANGECKKQNLKRTAENRRKVAENLLHKVRYNLIKSKFMVTVVANSGLLSLAERCKVLEFMLEPKFTRNIFWNTSERGPHTYNTWFGRFETESQTSKVACNGIEAISFRCFEDLYFHGFSLYGGCKRPFFPDLAEKFSVIAKIYDATDKVLSERQEEYDDDWRDHYGRSPSPAYSDVSDYSVIARYGESKHKNIMLRRKLKLQKNKMYSIVVDMHGRDTYCGRLGRSFIQGGDYYPGTTYDPLGNNMRNLVEFHDYEVTGYDGSTTVYSGQISRVGLSPIIPY